MLTELSPEEWARVAQVRADAIHQVLVDGVPFDEFKAAAAKCYATIGKEPPAVVVAPNPLVALAWSAMLRDRDQLGDQLGGQLGGQLRGQLGDQLRGQLGDQLRGQLGDHLGGQLGGQLWGQLGDQLWGQLGGQLRGQLRDQLRGQLRGVHWSAWRFCWLTHWLLINTIDGIRPAEAEPVATLDAYRTFCVPMFTIPLDGVVIALGGHLALHRDNVNRLHSETGPAWEWPGYQLWAWHGTVVPEWAITAPTLEQIAAEPNTEIRRCAIESFGWANYLTALDLTPVSVEDDPGNPGHQLALYDVPDAIDLFGGDVRLLVMQNASRDRDGSRRTFAETVPADCRTAIDAAAWQFKVDPTIYRSLQRAT